MTGYSSFVVVFAAWTGAAVVTLTLLLLAVIVAIRLVQARRLVWREQLVRAWRPVLTRALVTMPESSPRVSAREAAVVMPMWAYYHEFIRGESKANLNQLARLAGLDLYAKKTLRADSTRQRLLAIEALGHLRDRETRRLLRPIAYIANPYLSLAAAHALLRVDPREAIQEIVPLIASHPDWSPARVIAMLREAGPDVVSEPLARAAVGADVAYQPLLVIYLDTAHEGVASRAIRKIMLATDDEQVLVTCLYQLGRMAHPDSLKIVRSYLQHPNWLIQLHAVSGIGRMGSEADVDDLVRMLAHREFWIRYRAAQALSKLPTMTTQRLVEIHSRQDDHYARDILNQVITGEMKAA